MSALCANTSTRTVSPCIDSNVNVLLQTNPDFNQLLLEFIHILERYLIDPLLHDPPELVIDQTEVRAVEGATDPERCNLGFCALTVRSFCAPMRWCSVLLKHERATSDTVDSRKYYCK